MEPGGGFGVVKPINVDPEEVGLHDTNNSELSASTVSNSTVPQWRQPMPKKLKMKKKEEEKEQLEKGKQKQERRRRSSSG